MAKTMDQMIAEKSKKALVSLRVSILKLIDSHIDKYDVEIKKEKDTINDLHWDRSR